ncbi:hypothetical protein [Leptolyngbya sp. FACHB-261]|uniref:hypothetical protein n=1 Tax=Leptolyngbya sp. FACHB-261 TaxID=2692806 RepID=UPI001684FA7F|nr:hypothetical protein [Leptolyngbya sp. FACHB-261]
MNSPDPSSPSSSKLCSPDAVAEKVDSLVNYIQQEIHSRGKKAMTWQVQEELAQLINLLQRVEKRFLKNEAAKQPCVVKQKQLKSSLDFVEIAIKALFEEQPNLCLSRKIRRNIEYFMRMSDIPVVGMPINFFHGVTHLSSTITKVIFGLAISLPLCAGLLGYAIYQLNSVSNKNAPAEFAKTAISIDTRGQSTLPEGSQVSPITAPGTSQAQIRAAQARISEECLFLLILTGSAGALGSIISILTRIEQYQSKEYEDSALPIFIGAFKPIIGASFGILIFTLVTAEIFPFKIPQQESKGAAFFALAFIIGFSERFANDIVSRTENSLSGVSGKPTEAIEIMAEHLKKLPPGSSEATAIAEALSQTLSAHCQNQNKG